MQVAETVLLILAQTASLDRGEERIHLDAEVDCPLRHLQGPGTQHHPQKDHRRQPHHQRKKTTKASLRRQTLTLPQLTHAEGAHVQQTEV